MRVQVDQARCEGHGMCEQAAPDVFALDDEGMVGVIPSRITDSERRAAEAGIRACPVAALSLIDE